MSNSFARKVKRRKQRDRRADIGTFPDEFMSKDGEVTLTRRQKRTMIRRGTTARQVQTHNVRQRAVDATRAATVTPGMTDALQAMQKAAE